MQLSPTSCGRDYASPSPISEDMSTSAGRNSPPSLLIIGNNSLKQLAFGARANSPAPICRTSNYHDSECSRCARRIMLFLKVVMVVSKSQCAWVKNGDAPDPAGIVGTVPAGTHFRPVSANHRMKWPQTTERNGHKQPNETATNHRTATVFYGDRPRRDYLGCWRLRHSLGATPSESLKMLVKYAALQ